MPDIRNAVTRTRTRLHTGRATATVLARRTMRLAQAALAGAWDAVAGELTAPDTDPCHSYEIDGDTVSVHADRPLDDAGRQALSEIAHAIKAMTTNATTTNARPTETQLREWRARIDQLPMSVGKALADRILTELHAERDRPAAS